MPLQAFDLSHTHAIYGGTLAGCHTVQKGEERLGACGFSNPIEPGIHGLVFTIPSSLVFGGQTLFAAGLPVLFVLWLNLHCNVGAGGQKLSLAGLPMLL